MVIHLYYLHVEQFKSLLYHFVTVSVIWTGQFLGKCKIQYKQDTYVLPDMAIGMTSVS